MKQRTVFILAILIMISPLLFAGGSREDNSSSDKDADDRLKVFVSVLPQKYFVEQIAGDRADVQVMVSPGKSPATYEPTPRQMLALGESDTSLPSGFYLKKILFL